MHSIQRISFAFALTLVALMAFGGMSFAQVQPAAPAPGMAQNAGFCGGRPLCFEANDFAATILLFRTSDGGGYKILDADVRFQNKTNRPLILAYTDGSAFGIDDRGNRFVMNWMGGNGIRGMGVVSGNNIDPKFMLQPGGAADAHYELVWHEGGVQGVSYEVGLSIREINALEANQYSVGSETPLDYQGLTNGVGTAPPTTAIQAGQNPCSPTGSSAANAMGTASQIAGAANTTGAQNTTGTNQVSGAMSTISNLGSMLHGNSTTGTANTANSTPCPASGYNGTSAYGSQIMNGAQQMMGTTGAAPNYGAPAQNYGTPVQNYQAPPQYNTAPQQYYNAPPTNYSNVAPNYGTSPQNYATQPPSSQVAPPASQMKATTVQPAATTVAPKMMAQPVRAAAPQPVKVVTPVVQATQPARVTTPNVVQNAVQMAPAAQAKPSPAQPVRAVAKAPVPPPPAKKPGTR